MEITGGNAAFSALFTSVSKVGIEFMNQPNMSKFTNRISRFIFLLKFGAHSSSTPNAYKRILAFLPKLALPQIRGGSGMATKGLNILMALDILYPIAVREFCNLNCCQAQGFSITIPY